jgi:hypothetical protein
VIFAIITDGYENASVEYKRAQIFEMVSHQRKKYSWDFIFLGADIDAWGQEIGISINVDIKKNDLSRSYKALSMHALNERAHHYVDASETFSLSEHELDQKMDDLEMEKKSDQDNQLSQKVISAFKKKWKKSGDDLT